MCHFDILTALNSAVAIRPDSHLRICPGIGGGDLTFWSWLSPCRDIVTARFPGHAGNYPPIWQLNARMTDLLSPHLGLFFWRKWSQLSPFCPSFLPQKGSSEKSRRRCREVPCDTSPTIVRLFTHSPASLGIVSYKKERASHFRWREKSATPPEKRLYPPLFLLIGAKMKKGLLVKRGEKKQNDRDWWDLVTGGGGGGWVTG